MEVRMQWVMSLRDTLRKWEGLKRDSTAEARGELEDKTQRPNQDRSAAWTGDIPDN